MGFFDFNIPYHESDRHISAAEKATLKSHRLKLTIKAAELGYTGVAYNRTIKGVMSDSDRCSISLFPLSSLLKVSPSLSSSVKFHRDLLNVPVSTPFRQYTRLTVVIDSLAQAAALNPGNPTLKSYDIIAVRPMNQNSFEQACQTSEIHIIAIDFSEKLPFRLKQTVVKAAIERGVYFEMTYCSLIMDTQERRQMISNAKLLVDWTRGKNLIVSSAAPSVSEIRGPYDVANLSFLLGLQFEHAKAALSKNCRSVIANALRKKQYYKEAIKVEVMPSSGQLSSKEPAFDEWLNWDPISSGEGDLLLDDIQKSFSACGGISNTGKVVDFASALHSLPSHGLQIKDIIPLAKNVPDPVDVVNNLSNAEETEVLVPVNGISEGSCVLNLLHKKSQTSGQAIPQFSSHEGSTMPILHDSTVNGSVHVEENHIRVVTLEEMRRSEELEACFSHPKAEVHNLHSKNPRPSFDGHALLQDDAALGRCANDTEIAYTCDGFASAEISIRSKDSITPISIEESKMSVSPPVGLHVESVSSEKDTTETDCKSEKELSLASSDESLRQEFGESEQFQEKRENIVSSADELLVERSDDQVTEENKILVAEIVPMQEDAVEEQQKGMSHVSLADEFSVEESHDQIKEENESLVAEIEPVQKSALKEEKEIKIDVSMSYQVAGESLSGRGRLKRRAAYQPLLFPFKNLLISKPSKKKFRS